MKILILGHGEIGSALGKILANKGFEICFWDKDPAKTTLNISLEEMCKTSEFVFLCVPSWCLREALLMIKPFLNQNAILVNLAKGMEPDGKIMPEVIKELVPNNFVLMSGPMLAEEISQDKFGSAVLAALNAADADSVSGLFEGTNIETEISSDVHSVAFAGVLKNVYALIIGIVSGLGFGDNLKGDLVSRILEEWDFLAEVLSLNKNVLWGRAGEGDFIATSFSQYSKNHELGEILAKGEADGIKSEGLESLPGLIKVALEKNKKLPRYLDNLKRIVIDREPAAEVLKFDSR